MHETHAKCVRVESSDFIAIKIGVVK